MPTFSATANVHTKAFVVGDATAAVNAGVRLYTGDNQIGTTYGAPMPLVDAIWSLGNAGGAGYGLESNGTSNNPLPLPMVASRAIKIQLRGDHWPNAFTPYIQILDPSSNSVTGYGGNQSGIVGMSGAFGAATSRGAWVELIANISLDGIVTISYSKWAAGEAPGTHAASQTVTATSTNRISLSYPELGAVFGVADNSTTISEYKIWWGTPDDPPAGLAAIPTETTEGWQYNSNKSLFPISEIAPGGGVQNFNRDCTMMRGGTHIMLEFYGFYGKDDLLITPASYAISALRCRIGAGPWTDFAGVTVTRGDIKTVSVAFPHNAGDVVEIEGTATGSHIPTMAGGYPYLADDGGNATGLVFGILSKGFSSDNKVSIIALTDSRGIFYASQGIVALGHGCHNITVGGMKFAHVAGGTGGLKRHLLRRSRYIYIDMGANDLIVDSASGAELAERHNMLLSMAELQGAHILQATLAPVASVAQAALAGSTWTLEKTQPRLMNATGTTAYRFNEALERQILKGAVVDLTGVTTEPATGVWKAGISSDGQHYTTPGNTAVQALQQAAITAYLDSLDDGGSGGGEDVAYTTAEPVDFDTAIGPGVLECVVGGSVKVLPEDAADDEDNAVVIFLNPGVRSSLSVQKVYEAHSSAQGLVILSNP